MVMVTSLPIDAALPEIVMALRTAGTVVLRAPTGAGKTTRVPPALLDAGLADRGAIVVLQPRRLAARACAHRMAWERGARLGGEVGYHVRFDRCMGPETRIQVVTEGVLLRMIQGDPFLENTAVVVFDEFHERKLDSDLALAMVRRIRETVRPELKIVVMSATLEPEPVARCLGGCPAVDIPGRLHPVTISYVEDLEHLAPADAAAEATYRILDRTDGDVLVFLPGLGEIRQTARRLESLAASRNLAVLPLYGDLPAEKQDEVLQPMDRRKIVLATNVAQTSITIEGITGVVDTGLERRLVFNPRLGLNRLELARISQAAAEQRAGRAGRTRPGVCLRLWPERTHSLRRKHDEPEIRRLELAGAVLQLKAWGERDVKALPWFEAPAEASLDRAEALLRRLGALDASGRITETGRAMAQLPVSPRLGRMILEGARLGQARTVALAAALLSERDPFPRDNERSSARAAPIPSDSDVLDRIAALEAFEQSGRLDSPLGRIHRWAARFVLHARDQLLKELRRAAAPSAGEAIPEPEAVAKAILAAFPDRLARRSSPGSRFGKMVGGRGVRLAASSAVRDAPLFVAVEVEEGTSEAVAWIATAIRREWLPAERLATGTEVEFDRAAGKVIARRRLYWDDLLLDQWPDAAPDPAEAARILASAAADAVDAVFPWDDPATADYVRRVRCLAQWMPELGLPSLDESCLRALVPEMCRGRRSFEELRRAPWLEAIRGLLTAEQRQAVEREAPARLQVPSGSWIRLAYEPGKAPVLAVRIQEVFGLRETPRVAGGRVAVLLHLLAPSLRVQQVTDDLASFWKTTYHQVRKDLRRRYPKHAWPEDPFEGVAEQRPRRKNQS